MGRYEELIEMAMDARRIAYAPADVPSNVAETYYASLDLVDDIDFLIKNGTLMDMADEVRSKTGTTEALTPTKMLEAIASMSVIPTISNPAETTEVFLNKEYIDGEGNKHIGSFTIENELSEQDALLEALESALDGKITTIVKIGNASNAQVNNEILIL